MRAIIALAKNLRLTKDISLSTVGVRELKSRLARYLHQAKQGQEVVVTERGKPIALLTPVSRTRRTGSLEARLARLAAQGLVTCPTRKPVARRRPIAVSGPPLSHLILEDRR